MADAAPAAVASDDGAPAAQALKGAGRRWTKEEDEKLREAVAEVGPQNWKLIATKHLAGHGRSDVQCLHRWQKVLRPGLVKGPWTTDEDRTIVECVKEGVTKWSEVADRIPGRLYRTPRRPRRSVESAGDAVGDLGPCLLYTSPSPRDRG